MRCAQVHPNLLPLGREVVTEYRQMGGNITEGTIFGSDPFDNNYAGRMMRDRDFTQVFPSLVPINSFLVNGQEGPFENALLEFINITNRYML